MRLSYDTQTMDGSRWYRCLAEGYESGPLGRTFKRGVSDWHPAKGIAKKEALSRLQNVLC